MKLKFILFIYILLFIPMQISAKGTAYKIKTANGSRYGFFISNKGHFITDSTITKGITIGNIVMSRNVSQEAYVISNKLLEGYSILKTKESDKPYTLGDSDTVDIGDKIYIPVAAGKNYKKAKVLFKLNNFNEYYYPCFIPNIRYNKADIGKPVLNVNKHIIGILTSYNNNFVIVPINRVKPLIRDELSVNIKNNKPPNKKDTNNSESKKENFSLDSIKPTQQYGGNPYYHFGSIKDMAFDQDNNLYIIDEGYKEIRKIVLSGLTEHFIKPDNKKDIHKGDVNNIIKINKPLIDNPISLAVNKSGQVYVLDSGLKSILVLNRNLKIVKKYNYSNILKYIKPKKIMTYGNEVFITSDTNRLFHVSLQKKTDGLISQMLVRRDGEGLSLDIIDSDFNNNKLFWITKNSIQKMTKNRSISTYHGIKKEYPKSISAIGDRIYILNSKTKKIGIYTKKGKFIRYFAGNILTRRGNPSFMKVSSTGILAVAYDNNSHIRLYHLDGRLIKVLSSFSHSEKEFDSPLSIAVDGLGRLNIVTGNTGLYLIENANTDSAKTSIKYLSKADLSLSLRGITSVGPRDVFVSDTKKSSLMFFYGNSKYNRHSYRGKELGELNQPIQLASSNNKVYVLDKENHRVVGFNSNGSMTKSFYIKDKENNIIYPQDIAVSPNNEVYILAENKILKFNSHGIYESEVNIEKASNSFMGYAKGIAYYNGHLFISDTYNHRILVYNNNNLIGTIGGVGWDIDKLFYPWDIIANKNGIYIADKGNHRVVKYSLGTDKADKKDGKSEDKKIK